MEKMKTQFNEKKRDPRTGIVNPSTINVKELLKQIKSLTPLENASNIIKLSFMLDARMHLSTEVEK